MSYHYKQRLKLREKPEWEVLCVCLSECVARSRSIVGELQMNFYFLPPDFVAAKAVTASRRTTRKTRQQNISTASQHGKNIL